MLKAGLKLNLLMAMYVDTGRITCEGIRSIHIMGKKSDGLNQQDLSDSKILIDLVLLAV